MEGGLVFLFRPTKRIAVPSDDVRTKPDGYTEVWRNGNMVGLYRTDMLVNG